jgi:hypothetical protein
LLLLVLASAVALAVLAAPAMADGNSLGPPGSTIYAFDEAYETIATPTALPDNGPFDTIYVFPDNGGRWMVVQAFGITSQLTNAEDVVAAASSLVDTGTRFVCPLIKA